MIKEIWESLRDNVKERTTNPFLGTLLIVWILHNWKLVYGLFNFDSDKKLNDKIAYVELYFSSNRFDKNLVIVVFYTLGAITLTYALLNVSRLLINFFEKVVTPRMYALTDKSSIILKSEYEKLELQNRSLQEKVESERESKIRYQQERDELEKQLQKTISKDGESGLNIPDESVIKMAYNEIFKIAPKILDEYFRNLSEQAVFNDGDSVIPELLKYGFIEVHKRGTGRATYNFTEKGKRLRDVFYSQQMQNL